MFPHSDPLQMYQSLSVAFEQGPLPPPTILSEAGLNLLTLGRTGGAPGLPARRRLCLVSRCESEHRQAGPMTLTSVCPGSSRDSTWSQKLTGSFRAQETPPTSVSMSLLAVTRTSYMRPLTEMRTQRALGSLTVTHSGLLKISPLLPVLPGICMMDPEMLLRLQRYTEALPTLTLALPP